MKNYFTKDEADNIQLMLQSSKEGEFKDLNTSKFFEFFILNLDT